MDIAVGGSIRQRLLWRRVSRQWAQGGAWRRCSTLTLCHSHIRLTRAKLGEVLAQVPPTWLRSMVLEGYSVLDNTAMQLLLPLTSLATLDISRCRQVSFFVMIFCESWIVFNRFPPPSAANGMGLPRELSRVI